MSLLQQQKPHLLQHLDAGNRIRRFTRLPDQQEFFSK